MRDADRAKPRALRHAARREHYLHERLGAAVGRGQLGAVHADLEVVDPEAGRRRHEVLDGLDARPVLADRRRVVGIDDALGHRGDRVATLADAEDDAGVRGRGGEHHTNRLARMQPNTFQADRLPDGVLSHDRVGEEQRECQSRAEAQLLELIGPNE